LVLQLRGHYGVWSKYPNALFYQKLRTRPDHHLVLNFTPH
jgi:hypothetical protein